MTTAYIEEGVVRRELSDNFVYYTGEDYDELSGAAQWAQDSLELHTSDEREWLFGEDVGGGREPNRGSRGTSRYGWCSGGHTVVFVTAGSSRKSL